MYRSDRLNAVIVAFIFGFSALLLLYRLIILIQYGGSGFQHADWLINFSDGVVRRGISGEFFLALGAVLSANPLYLVGVAQGALILLLIGGLFLKGWTLGMTDRVVLLLLSPALIIFWVNSPESAYRKEIIGLCAFLPLLFARTSGPWGTALSVTIFGVAAFFYEANAFLAPGLMLMLQLRHGAQGTGVVRIVALLAAASLVFAAVFVDLPTSDGMCRRILAAGLDDPLCRGIFPWLAEGFDGTTDKVAFFLDELNVSLVVAIAAVVLLHIPCIWIARRLLRGRLEWSYFLLSSAVIFALYPLATDWSRWLSMQVFVMTFVLFLLGELRGGLDRPVPQKAFAFLLAVFLGVGINHIAPTPVPGVVFWFWESVERLTD